MKKYYFLILLFTSALNGFSQASEAPYKSNPTIPEFNLLISDTTWYSKKQLPFSKYTYTVFIYFSPDCGHCQHTAKNIALKMDSLQMAFFVFVAYKPLDEIKSFGEYFGLYQFPNVVIGRDPAYFIPSFFRVTRTPYIAVYNQQGLLHKVYDPEIGQVPEVSELIQVFNQKQG